MKKDNQNKPLTFEKEGSTWFGIINDAIFEGKQHDELLYCEVEEGGMLRWEDSYLQKHVYKDTETAKSIACRDYLKHTPHSNGRNYEI